MRLNSPGPRADRRPRRHLTRAAACLWLAAVATMSLSAASRQTGSANAGAAPRSATNPVDPAATRAVLDKYCVTCHNQRLRRRRPSIGRLRPTLAGRSCTVSTALSTPTSSAISSRSKWT
jgi:hypothetical protein